MGGPVSLISRLVLHISKAWVGVSERHGRTMPCGAVTVGRGSWWLCVVVGWCWGEHSSLFLHKCAGMIKRWLDQV